MRSRAVRLGASTHVPNDTTWVGYNPAYAGSNYWSVGVGHRFPPGTFGPAKGDIPANSPDNTGYWDWDHPVHGDSLQGWWPVHNLYTTFAIAGQNDKLRPWHAVDIGNVISYTINQGNPYRRTFGVSSAWHVDGGRNEKVPNPSPIKSDVNPKPPRWTPIAGSSSAWCGLRAHGDIARVDALTGNPYNVDAYENVAAGSPTIPVAPGFTNRHFPGYAGQWDQMLYHDVNIGSTTEYPSATPVSLSFSYRTRMSTGKGTTSTQRTGWFDKDPLAVVAGNFISSSDAGNADAPIDSFMVYVGQPVGDNAGDTWTGSDGGSHQVFDPVRRWFAELIRANDPGGYFELFTTYGNNPALPPALGDSNTVAAGTATRPDVTYGSLRAAWGNKIRVVFRIKTNRGSFNLQSPSDDGDGSLVGAYTSGYMGAAEIDDVSLNRVGGNPPGWTSGFEAQSDINNSSAVSALNAWKTSSKPPSIYHHVHALTTLIYQDLCGPPGSTRRICDMAGNVVSMGNHDDGERNSGPPNSAEQEHFQGMFSPSINLAYNPGSPTSKNNMGLDADTAVPTSDFLIGFNVYTGYFDLFNLGSGYQFYWQSYPAQQSDGTRMWGEIRFSRFQEFNPDKQCYDEISGANEQGQVKTTNPGGQPDSIRIGLRKLQQCYRFGITVNCNSNLGGYFDNVSAGFVDGAIQPISVLIWELFNDTFPANEDPGLPGTAAFDTTTALIRSGLNSSPLTGDLTRYDVPEDTLDVEAAGDSVEVQLKFRILPGPGNYSTVGTRCSGLRAVATDPTKITPSDGSFWTEYILNPGKDKQSFPTSGPCGVVLQHNQRWSEFVWCNARCDTAEQTALFPIAARGINTPLQVGTYATMYHESDKHLAVLGIPRHKCFLIDTLGTIDYTNITCSSVPAWVTASGIPYKTGYDGFAFTTEGTKIIPDGLLTPGSHVEYYFEKKELGTGAIALCPDTSLVFPQNSEGSFDAHRWQEFSVLPDAWKFSTYSGLGKACMLFVDWNDRRGNERVWVSVADSIGATAVTKRGSHNGWTAPSVPKDVDINDPKWHVDKNAQPGTTWDMYGVKACESLNSSSGSIGARHAYRGAGTLLTDKVAKNAPTDEMLEAYYRVIMIMSGDLNSTIIGPFDDRSQDDALILHNFLLAGLPGNLNHRGLIFSGDGLIEDMQFNCDVGGVGQCQMLGDVGVSLRDASYIRFSGNNEPCIDLIPTSVITTNGDIYGLRNTCLFTLDVLNAEAASGGQPASYYDPVNANPLNAPYISGVFHDVGGGAPENQWQSLVDGWNVFNLRNKQCDKTFGRLGYYWSMLTNIFGKICSIAGTGPQTTEVPNNDSGKLFVDFAGIRNNPLRQGNAVINLTLAKADRVTVKIYDVSGRLVRTLADGQMFPASTLQSPDRALTWDGLDNNGRQVTRGAYFVSVKFANSKFENSRKMIVLK
ncbi:MAG TPA: FlgD immunoglobulin-like domain containing protein [Candidatus Eisenbacteria bacterium]